jgi:hypothetical protein
MYKVFSIILYLIIVCNSTIAQWNVGASYKFKAYVPENGIGIHVSRNLPVQHADFGFNIRAEINIFRSSENSEEGKKNYLSEDYHAEFITTFFLKNYYPYLGFGGGYGHINLNELNKGSIILCLIAGIRFPVSRFFYPYIEVQGFNYFSDLNKDLAKKDISSFQVRGVIGVSFILNTIE